MWHRRLAECRQIDALQRADPDRGRAGRQLSVLHHRAQCGRGGGAGSAAGQACGARQVGHHRADAAGLRGHRRPGARGLQGRGPRQPVPRPYPRGRRHRACGALLRGPRRHPCGEQDRSDRRHRDHRDRADAGRPRQPGAARGRPGEKGQGQRQGGGGGQGDARSRQSRAGPAARAASPPAWSNASPQRRRRSMRSAC